MHVYSGCIRLWIHSGRDIHPLSGNMSTCLQVPRLINEMYITPLVYLWFTSTNHHVSVANLNFHSDTGVVKSKGVICTCIMCWGYLQYAHNNNVIIWLSCLQNSTRMFTVYLQQGDDAQTTQVSTDYNHWSLCGHIARHSAVVDVWSNMHFHSHCSHTVL